MFRRILKNKVRVVQFVFLVALLVLIRSFEDYLFDDPFLDYFKKDFANLPLPNFNSLQLFLGLLFRYGLNTAISLAIIYVLFKEIIMVKFAAVLYGFFFIILIVAFFFVIYFCREGNGFTLFYIHWFLIQPIFILLFIAGFYYEKQKK